VARSNNNAHNKGETMQLTIDGDTLAAILGEGISDGLCEADFVDGIRVQLKYDCPNFRGKPEQEWEEKINDAYLAREAFHKTNETPT
jgi:hypothetical protein